MDEAAAMPGQAPFRLKIDLQRSTVITPRLNLRFSMAGRHRQMLLDGTDMIGASLAMQGAIDAFARRHWAARPWLHDVARRTRQRLDEGRSAPNPEPR
jgi:3-isopropylmalate/(R)-2-methylmalate dehydratase small subunit